MTHYCYCYWSLVSDDLKQNPNGWTILQRKGRRNKNPVDIFSVTPVYTERKNVRTNPSQGCEP